MKKCTVLLVVLITVGIITLIVGLLNINSNSCSNQGYTLITNNYCISNNMTQNSINTSGVPADQAKILSIFGLCLLLGSIIGCHTTAMTTTMTTNQINNQNPEQNSSTGIEIV